MLLSVASVTSAVDSAVNSGPSVVNSLYSDMTRDEHRQIARDTLNELLGLLNEIGGGGAAELAAEGEKLRRSIDAFHLEGIRFRMFDFDRRLQRLPGGPPERAATLFAELRAALEAAGFHTRSH